ncbi:30S ribosomal protein S1 [Fulvivirgaceae bacterium BMA12]|uniref:30S ribosomal protein S1 n=1 Tax=Agaribacillus aureus TaxID=3051825 RepID=A0ABT8L2I8_9BACT|nr:30S ribosomal protein S1 [Fulvivirgaceae bacterium BMA12]
MSETPEEFDWDNVEPKGFGENYSDKEKEELIKMYEGTLNEIQEKEVVTGTVVGISDRDVILNIGFKSDGLVSASEFRDLEDLKIGDEVQVYIEEQENANGQLVLSRRKAKIVKAWEQIQQALDKDEVIEGMVKRRTKGGLIVDIFGVEAFLPGSQIDVKPIRDFDVFVGNKMEVKVVKINYSNDNVVVSHKVLIEKDLEKQKIEILNNLEKGQVLEGVIKNMTNFGVFIDLGGVDGLLHITDISWGRINHPEEVLQLDQKVNVVVLDFDDNKKRISLGMKQLTAHPWDSLSEDIQIGSHISGSIVNVADYGAFLEIQPGVEGLIHVSEMSWSQHLRNPQDFINIGDKLEAVVLTLDREERKMSLGIKQLTEDPWTKENVLTKYAVGTKHKGIVRNLTNFGLFIELEEGIDGLVHVSDLSWTKKIKHPSEFVKVGDKLEVQVLELDVENRRLALGHKQLEENPWDTFETVFTIGSEHKCSILSKTDKGAVLELPYGIEGFATVRHLVKEDGTPAEAGETLTFKVIEFSKDDKRIVMSHTNVHSAAAETSRPKRKKSPKSTIDKINKDSEKSTLGDLEALSALKSQMEGKSAPAPAEKKVEKPKAAETAKKEAKVEAKAEEVAEEAPKAEEPAAAAPAEEVAEAPKAEEKPEEAAEEVKAEAEEVVEEKVVEEKVEEVAEEAKEEVEEPKATKKKAASAKKEEVDEAAEEKTEE